MSAMACNRSPVMISLPPPHPEHARLACELNVLSLLLLLLHGTYNVARNKSLQFNLLTLKDIDHREPFILSVLSCVLVCCIMKHCCNQDSSTTQDLPSSSS
mmetsp:Transcript_1960/g.5895  ORF Transcript_1960/g.5895 Transcript_1960/m.5895 type:complete len:101 (-) Transcript_1960:30-332(-)